MKNIAPLTKIGTLGSSIQGVPVASSLHINLKLGSGELTCIATRRTFSFFKVVLYVSSGRAFLVASSTGNTDALAYVSLLVSNFGSSQNNPNYRRSTFWHSTDALKSVEIRQFGFDWQPLKIPVTLAKIGIQTWRICGSCLYVGCPGNGWIL